MDLQLSIIEKLPKELTWMIIDYVPEAVCEMRLVSKTLRDRVDSYPARMGLVKELVIEGAQRDELRIAMQITPNYANLFELRLNKIFARHNCSRDRVRRDEPNGRTNTLVHRIRIYNNEGAALSECLSECISPIDNVWLMDCSDSATRDSISILLSGLKFKRLWFQMREITDSDINYLHKIIYNHEVDQLTLTVWDIVTDKPMNFLLDLSTLVRSLQIYQTAVTGVDGNARYFLGLYDADWASTILEMFGSDKRLEKLNIFNNTYSKYLSLSSTTSLCENLPNVGKKVWFETERHLRGQEGTSKINGHYVKDGKKFLSIKHSTRVNEPF